MQLRKLAMSLAAASALTAAPAFAQTAVVVDPSLPADRTAPVVVVTPANSPTNNYMYGEHQAVDQYGHAIIVDDSYGTKQSYGTQPYNPRRTVDPNADAVTGVVTAPGYMGPRDTTGQ